MNNKPTPKFIRCFFAVTITKEMLLPINPLITELKIKFENNHQIIWIPPTNIHLTLKFLGNTKLTSIENMITKIKDDMKDVRAFDLSFDRIASFPNHHKPRTLALQNRNDEALQSLVQQLETILIAYDIKKDPRAFISHISIAKIRNHAYKKPLLVTFSPITFKITQFHLYSSDTRAEGPVYHILNTINLKT